MAIFIPTSRAKRRYSVGLPEVCCATVAPWLALALRDTRLFEPVWIEQTAIFCGIALIVGISMLSTSNICNTILLNISVSDQISIFRCAFLTSTITSILAFLITRLDSILRSVPVIHLLIYPRPAKVTATQRCIRSPRIPKSTNRTGRG